MAQIFELFPNIYSYSSLSRNFTLKLSSPKSEEMKERNIAFDQELVGSC